ncbi:Zn(2)-C6 fungal-type DNA-binding domain [Pleurostoma richardsiae]|uniref:Zn(2)-C6 fungal-type DNA-binding domain n=1 Tax=Pleurostoma richardsiae TaxID=41990 RepID=A0AA38VPM1_9PEZI|nr:Zn(2)-C6 fungal-type DNA-binding domain [Pleurostoma richardsiae]
MEVEARPQSSPANRRQRSGCLTCRDRKKRCDQNYPVCDACRRLNFVCRREDPQRPRKPGRPRRPSPMANSPKPASCACLSTRVPDISAFWLQNGAGGASADDHAPRRRLILRYYTQALAALITTNVENNCFLSVFLPLAMDSPVFLDTILAWSSTHLALRDESYQSLALQCRGTALRSLAASLPSLQRQPEIGLACCLVQCALESVSGDTKQWYTHIEGAHQIIRSACSPAEGKSTTQLDLRPFSSFEGTWLLRSFAYHDIMTTVAEDRKPLIVAGHYWLFHEQEPPDSLFGLGSKVMYLVSETSVLNVDMLECTDELRRRPDFVERAQQLEAELLSWQCGGPSTTGAAQSDDLVKLAEMYRNAALIHLYRAMRRNRIAENTSIERKIDAAVAGIIERLRSIPEKCLVESSLLFPLFMSGGETSDPELIEIIRRRMQDIIDFRHFRNFAAALKVLEELWHLRLSGRDLDWRDVLDRKKWMLSIT